MKKWLSLLLILCLCLPTFAACGESPTPPPPTPPTVHTVTLTVKDGTEFDTVPAAVRTYEAAAKNYDVADYSTTNKTLADAASAANTPLGVLLTWKYDTPLVSAATLFVSKDEDFHDAREYQVGSLEAKEITNLETGTTYYWKVEATFSGDKKATSSAVGTFKTAEGFRLLYLPGIGNARDVGGRKTLDGKTMLQGMVIRTRKLDSATEGTIDYLLNEYGVKTELDLRAEGTKCTFSNSEGVTYLKLGSASYDCYFQNDTKQTTADIMRVFADADNYPILFHCKGGADRTGSLAIMLELLCGMAENDTVADYGLTPGKYRNLTASYYNLGVMMNTVRAAAGATMQEKAYNLYHDDCGLTAMELSNIYNLLMNHSGVFESASLEKRTFSRSAGATFKLDLRYAEDVESVTIGGTEVDFNYDDGVLHFDFEQTGELSGEIVFSDGESLKFEFKATN